MARRECAAADRSMSQQWSYCAKKAIAVCGWPSRTVVRGVTRPGWSPDDDNDDLVTCVGNGGYEGLTAILVNDWTKTPVSINGLIFAGEVPPIP